MLLQATLALSLVVSSLKSVCCDFSIFSAVMPPIACPLFNLVLNSVVHSPYTIFCNGTQGTGTFCTGANPIVACMHHYGCVALCKDISLKRGRFCARSLASCIPRSNKLQVIINVLHQGCLWPPRWFQDGLASICVLSHSCKVPKESETTGLNNNNNNKQICIAP